MTAAVLPSCSPLGNRPTRTCSRRTNAKPPLLRAIRTPPGEASRPTLEQVQGAFAVQLASRALARVAFALDQGAQHFAASRLAGAAEGVRGPRGCSASTASSKPGCSEPVGLEPPQLAVAGTHERRVRSTLVANCIGPKPVPIGRNFQDGSGKRVNRGTAPHTGYEIIDSTLPVDTDALHGCCRSPFRLALLILQLAPVTLSMCHRAPDARVTYPPLHCRATTPQRLW